MANIKLTKTAEKELKKLADLNGFIGVEDYLRSKIMEMLVNELTATDVSDTKRQIEILRTKLNTKRTEISLELEEQKKVGD